MKQTRHFIQQELLKKLALSIELKFNELQIEGFDSEHLNYHLKKLLKEGLVLKDVESGLYKLTNPGKDLTSRFDDDIKIERKFPKVSVLFRLIRKNENGETENLCSKRLRQPYYGKVGALGGKIFFGESAQEVAERELLEETGLTAKRWHLISLYRKIRKNERGEAFHDVMFYNFVATEVQGELIKKTDLQENFWLTKEQMLSGDYDLYDDVKFTDFNKFDKQFSFFEDIQQVDDGY